MKQDLRINYGILKQIVNDANTYLAALEDIESSVDKIDCIIKQSSGKSIDALAGKGESFKKNIKSCKQELQDISRIFSDYIYAMTDIIYPINEYQMMQVDLNDIIINQIDIEDACSKISDHLLSSSIADSSVSIFKKYTPEEIANQKKNYIKLVEIKDMMSNSRYKFNEYIDELNHLCKKVKNYENMDDHFKGKASDFKDEYTDFWEGVGDFFSSIFNAVKEYITGIIMSLYEMIEGIEKFISGTKMYIGSTIAMGLDLLISGDPPKFVKDFFCNTTNSISAILKDPYLIAEGLFQGVSDSVEEDGIAYGLGYGVGTVGFGIIFDKGLAKIAGGSGKAVSCVDDLIKAGITSVDDLARIGVSSVDDLAKLGLTSVDDLAKLGISSVDDLAKLGLTSADDLAKIGITSVDDLVRFGVASAEDLVKLGLTSLDDLAKLGVSSVDDLAKLGLTSVDDLAKIGITSVDDLTRLGVSSVDDLAKLGISSVDDLAKLGIKSADDLAKIGINSVDDLEKLGIKLSTNQKGNFGEMKMDDFFENQGYQRISTERVTDINAPTHQGIDGVYYKPGPPPKYVIGEAKYGTSKLSTLTDGTKQMSDDWIGSIGRNKVSRLEQSVGIDKADDILLEGYDRILTKIDCNGTISTYMLDELGSIIK